MQYFNDSKTSLCLVVYKHRRRIPNCSKQWYNITIAISISFHSDFLEYNIGQFVDNRKILHSFKTITYWYQAVETTTSQIIGFRMSLEPDNSPILADPEEGPSKDESFDNNIYALTKTIAKGLLNVALLTDNAKQLKLTVELGPEKCEFYGLVLTLVIVSIVLQTTMAILGAFVGSKNINFEQNQTRATTLNRTILVCAILTVVDNIILAAFTGSQKGY